MNLEEKIIGEIAGSFKIEAYQRGCRWGKEEVKHHLEDIHEVQDSQKYCLQPVVVKAINNDFELIDGQQRLTTLYLIMKYLSTYIDINYSIEYTTREGSRKLLEQIEQTDCSSITARNIDELFIKRSYCFIKEWFSADKGKMMSFANKLRKYVTVIWYEVDDSEDSVSIFTRLNIGKISLNNAELVKALFLSRGKKISDGGYAGNPYGIGEKKQEEIALRWDAMEKMLHDEKFWAFITNEPTWKYPIRMELLFDLIESKPAGESDFYTFNRFYERFKRSANNYTTWELIERSLQQLIEWYNNFNMYHRIGFLVATGTSVKALLDMAMDKDKPLKKSEFKEKVLELIQKRMIFKKDGEEIEYAELNYEEHASEIKTLLLLFNVESIRQKGDENNRFPFSRYKHGGTWSLEHIHAQHSEGLNTVGEWRAWLETHKKSLEEVAAELQTDDAEKESIGNIIKDVDRVISHTKDNAYKGSIRDEFNAIAEAVIAKLSHGDDKSQMHTLSNMALLTVGDNAALSNSTFDVKRRKVIEMDKAGQYIPTCTRNVFLKYYSSADTRLHFWSESDRQGYIEEINRILYSEGRLIKNIFRNGNG